MFTITVSRKRLAEALRILCDKATCTIDIEHDNIWLSNADLRLRIPMLTKVGKRKSIKPFCLSEMLSSIMVLSGTRVHLTFLYKEKVLRVDEVVWCTWNLARVPRSLMLIDKPPVSPVYYLPQLHFDLMDNLSCTDKVLDISCWNGNHFMKYGMKFPDFKLSLYAMSTLREVGEEYISMQLCKDNYLLFKGKYFWLYVVNQAVNVGGAI